MRSNQVSREVIAQKHIANGFWTDVRMSLSYVWGILTGEGQEEPAYSRMEKHFVVLRYFCVLFAGPSAFLFGFTPNQLASILLLMAWIVSYNSIIYYLLNHREDLLVKGVVPAILDVSVAIILTTLAGGFTTPWYFCVYGVLVSVTARFGLKAAIGGSLGVAVIDAIIMYVSSPGSGGTVAAFVFRSAFLFVTVFISAFLFRQAKAASLALEWQLEQERMLNQATELLDATLDPKVVLQAAVEGATRIGRAKHGILQMKDPNAVLRCDPVCSPDPVQQEDETSVLEQVMRGAQLLEARKIAQTPGDSREESGIYLGFPLLRRGNCIGGIVLSWPDDNLAWQVEPSLTAFVERATVALENATLYERAQEMAVIDPLTGLSNHRYIKERLDVEIERAKRYGHEMSIAMYDLDLFREYNANYGHGAGDEVLKQISDVLRASVRSSDLVGRYGGEEFVLIMPETDIDTAVAAAERVRQTVEDLREPISVSVGVASFPSHGGDRDSLLNVVDLATYLAKHMGRNQVRSAVEVGTEHGLQAIFSELTGQLSQQTSTWGPGLATSLERRLKQLDELQRDAGSAEESGGLAGATVDTIMALAQTIDAKDPWTEGHSRNVANFAVILASALGLEQYETERLRTAGLLHDIGKIGVVDSVLKKPGPLTDEEWHQMREHPVIGSRILKPVRALAPVVEVVRHHHEWFNGNGYPDKIAGDQIPVGARILSICDAYDAMVTKRTYRESLGHEEAVRRLVAGKGTQFDPELVDVFIKAIESNEGVIAGGELGAKG